MNINNDIKNNKKLLIALAGGVIIVLVGGLAFVGGASLGRRSFPANPQGQFFQGQGNNFDGKGKFNSDNDQEMGRKDGSGQRMNSGKGLQDGTGPNCNLEKTIEGKIVSKDGQSFTIETQDGTKTIVLSDSTVVEKIVSQSANDLAVDGQIVVSADSVSSDSITAKTIKIK